MKTLPDQISRLPLRVLHLSAVDFGGAGSAAYRLHFAMRQRGLDSNLVVWDSRNKGDGIIDTKRPGWKAVRRLAGRIWYRGTSRTRYTFRDQSMRSLSRRRLTKLASDIKPNLIIVHYISNFLTFQDVALLQSLTGARVIFHLLDMGLFTGGCHYSWGCRGYQFRCGNCPALPARTARDSSSQILEDKLAAMTTMDFAVVAPSSQLFSEGVVAKVFENAEIHRIPIGVDPDKLGKYSVRAARNALGIDQNEIVLMLGAQNLDDPRKGIKILFESLKSLDSEEQLQRRVSLLIVGDAGELQTLSDLSIKTYLLGHVEANVLAQAYCAADFFVCPSVEDSGPMMVNESMMSGTPVVGFPIGVLPDLVVENKTGILAKTVDKHGLATAIAKALNWDEEERKLSRELCRAHAMEVCSLDAQVRSFVDLAPRKDDGNGYDVLEAARMGH